MNLCRQNINDLLPSNKVLKDCKSLTCKDVTFKTKYNVSKFLNIFWNLPRYERQINIQFFGWNPLDLLYQKQIISNQSLRGYRYPTIKTTASVEYNPIDIKEMGDGSTEK